MLDYVIRGGTIIDGTGSPGRSGDVGVRGGRIVDVGGRITEPARQEIDADGCVVAPGWVDIHTHYDGQSTWDDALDPSAANGVSTAIGGNCGIGFAPVRSGDVDVLIDFMEGVEDIPGSCLRAGIPWGAWETFPQYLDHLGSRKWSLDIGTQLPHGPLRLYAMGERGGRDVSATADELRTMSDLAREALAAGALGVTTSRTCIHRRASTGDVLPGTYAAEAELDVLASALRDKGRGVFQVVPSGVVGPREELGGERRTSVEEWRLLAEVSKRNNVPMSITLVQLKHDPEEWRRLLGFMDAANRDGARLTAQFSPRGIGRLVGLTTYHQFQFRKTFYETLRNLPFEQMLEEMRKPEVKAAILADGNVDPSKPGSGESFGFERYARDFPYTFPIKSPMDYEPAWDASVAGLAKARGMDPMELMYDLLVADGGRNFFWILSTNYSEYSLDHAAAFFRHPDTVTGLSDAGAHVSSICDMALPTFQLMHFGRDRTRGERLPLELIIAKQTRVNALYYGLEDRGALLPGLRADINVIDMRNLGLKTPVMLNDLPGGNRRVMQYAEGYVAGMVAGELTRMNGEDTGARPGRLIRG